MECLVSPKSSPRKNRRITMMDQQEFGSPSFQSPLIKPVMMGNKKQSTIKKSSIFNFVGKLSLRNDRPDDQAKQTDKFFYSILSPKKIKPFEQVSDGEKQEIMQHKRFSFDMYHSPQQKKNGIKAPPVPFESLKKVEVKPPKSGMKEMRRKMKGSLSGVRNYSIEVEEEKRTEFNDFSTCGGDGDFLRRQNVPSLPTEPDVDTFKEKYDEMERIGSGASATVYLCKNKETGVMYACKTMHNRDDDKLISCKAEYDLMVKIKPHTNIIGAIEFISTKVYLYNIIERAPGLELQQYIKQHQLTPSKTRSILKQLFEAISHLHEQKICHRDIKPDNIMINPENISLKLIDFNVSYIFDSTASSWQTNLGTPLFKAPEMVNDKKFNEKIDIWGAGTVMCHMLIGKIPENGNISDDPQTDYEITNPQTDEAFITLPKLEKDLLTKLLDTDIEKRLSAKDALKHDYFQQLQNNI